MLPERVENETYSTARNWQLLATPHITIQEGQAVIIPNRRDRRKNKQTFAPQTTVIKGELDRFRASFMSVGQRVEREIYTHERDLTRITFLGEPFIYEQMELQRKLPDLLERAHFVNLEKPFISPQELNSFDGVNSFSKKVGGISLLDIEQMELNEEGRLDTADIKRINKLYHDTQHRRLLSLWPFYKDQDRAQAEGVKEDLYFFVCQQEARPDEKISVPAYLIPLYERLIVYFDYYKDLLTNFDLGLVDEMRFVKTLSWTTPWMPQTLGCFVPARLGITPSSAFKLYQTRAESSYVAPFYWRRNILPYLEAGGVEACREKGLPLDLQVYQHYDPQMDETARNNIIGHYRGRHMTD